MQCVFGILHLKPNKLIAAWCVVWFIWADLRSVRVFVWTHPHIQEQKTPLFLWFWSLILLHWWPFSRSCLAEWLTHLWQTNNRDLFLLYSDFKLTTTLEQRIQTSSNHSDYEVCYPQKPPWKYYKTLHTSYSAHKKSTVLFRPQRGERLCKKTCINIADIRYKPLSCHSNQSQNNCSKKTKTSYFFIKILCHLASAQGRLWLIYQREKQASIA